LAHLHLTFLSIFILPTIRSIQAIDVKLTSQQIQSVQLLKRMGHASPTNIIAAIQNGIWTIEDVTPDLIRKVFQH